jgi:hypothetical protein
MPQEVESPHPEQQALFPELFTDEQPVSSDDPPVLPDEKPGYATGPRTVDGKKISSLNHLLHGCCSKQAVLPGEDPAEYAATIQQWFDQYQPVENDETMLVSETAMAHWLFKRTSKRLAEIEARLPRDAWHFTDEHQSLLNNFNRYKTTAERSLLRWYKELEAYKGRHWQHQQAQQLLQAKIAASEISWLKDTAKVIDDELRVTQLVKVYQRADGSCVSDFSPSNERILSTLPERTRQPVVFERFLDFPKGVPSQYSWVHPNLRQTTTRCAAIQYLSFIDWRRAVPHELETGHIQPQGFLQPKPAS